MFTFTSVWPGRDRPLAAIACKLASAGCIVISLSACDQLARFTTRPDATPVSAKAAPAAEQKSSEQSKEQPADPVAAKPAPPKPKKPPLYEWKNSKQRIDRIVINTDEQKARFYAADGQEVGWSTVATGVSKHPTPTGSFEIMSKKENKRSNLYGKVKKNGRVIKTGVKVGRDRIPAGGKFEGARMPYFMRLTYDGIGLHAGSIPRPGRPASHGCIRMPKNVASRLFQSVRQGTPVVIEGSGPSYGNYVQKQRAIAAQRAKEQRARKAQQQRAAAAAKRRQLAQAEAARSTVAPTPAGDTSIATPRPVAKPLAQSPSSSSASETGASTVSGTSTAEAAANTQTPPAPTPAASQRSETPASVASGTASTPDAPAPAVQSNSPDALATTETSATRKPAPTSAESDTVTAPGGAEKAADRPVPAAQKTERPAVVPSSEGAASRPVPLRETPTPAAAAAATSSRPSPAVRTPATGTAPAPTPAPRENTTPAPQTPGPAPQKAAPVPDETTLRKTEPSATTPASPARAEQTADSDADENEA